MLRALGFQRGAAVAVAMLVLPLFWSQTAVFAFGLPQTGAAVRAEAASYTVLSVAPNSAAAKAGLRAGDVVPSSDNGIGPGDVLFSDTAMPAARLHTVALPVARNGATRIVAVHPQSTPYRWLDRLRVTARLLSFSAFVLLATWVVLVRPNAMTWLLLAFCIGTIAPTGDLRGVVDTVFGAGSAPDIALGAMTDAIQRIGVISIPLFALRFPNNEPERWRAAVFAPAVWLLGLYAIATWFVATFWYSEAADDLIGWIDIALQLSGIAVLGVTYLQSIGMDKVRLKWGFAGTAIGVGCSLGNEFARVISHHSELGINVGALFTVAAVAMPICLAYAIVRHEIIDIRFVLNRTAVYGTVLASFAGVFISIDWFFTYHVRLSSGSEAIAMAAAFALGFVFRDSRDAMIAAVDRVLFPRHHSKMLLLRDLRLRLERGTHSDSTQEFLTSQAAAALNVSSAALFAHCDDGGFVREAAIGWMPGSVWHLLPEDQLVHAVARARGKSVRTRDEFWTELQVPGSPATPVLAVPIVFRKQLLAFVLYGQHDDCTDIDPDEAAALSDLCSAAGPAFFESRYPAPSVFAAAAFRATP